MMNREYLLRKLDTVSPALAANSLIPILQHFWFTGKSVMAYNDQIAIRTPLKTEFEGAVPGAILIQMLNAIQADDVELEVKGASLHIKAGKGDYKLNLLPASAYEKLFKMPPFTGGDIVGAEKEFLAGIRNCNRSVTNDTSVPEQLGITLVPTSNAGGADMYSTSNTTLCHSKVPFSKGVKFKRVILSGAFCEQVEKLGSKAEVTDLSIRDDHSMFKADKTMLFGRLIARHPSSDLDFAGVLNNHLPKEYQKAMWEIPEQLAQIIDRACIITSATVDQTRTKVTMNGANDLRFYSKSDRGEALDDLPLKGGKQGKVEINFDPGLVKNGLTFSKMLFTDACVIMTDEHNQHLYLVGATKR